MASTKQNSKHKFNAVDAVIIIIVVTALGVGAYLFLVRGIGETNESFYVEYVLEFRGIRDEFLNCFKVGSKVVDSAAKYQLGDVIAVNSEVTIFNGTNTIEGKLVYFEYPEHSDVSMTVRSKASLNDEGMYVLDYGYRISVGSTVYIRMPDYTGMAYCTRIKEVVVK